MLVQKGVAEGAADDENSPVDYRVVSNISEFLCKASAGSREEGRSLSRLLSPGLCALLRDQLFRQAYLTGYLLEVSLSAIQAGAIRLISGNGARRIPVSRKHGRGSVE